MSDFIRRRFRRRPLACAALLYAAGCLLGLQASVPYEAWLFAASVFCLISLVGARRAGAWALMALVFVGAGYTALRAERPRVVTGEYAVTGVICRYPKSYPDQGYTVLTLKDARAGETEIVGRVRITVYGAFLPDAGARVRVENARLWQPKGQTNPNGFDYAAYLWREGISVCATAQAENAYIAEASSGLDRLLSGVRARLSSRIDSLFSGNAPLARALLLGDRTALSEDLNADFQVLGIAHLLALSGLHVSLIAGLIGALMRMLTLPRLILCVLLSAFLGFYVLIVGASNSIMRAVILFALSQSAWLYGNPFDRLTGLSVAAIILLAVNPLMLADVGFLLSFGCALAIILIVPVCARFLRVTHAGRQGGVSKRIYGYFGGILAMSVGIQILILPLMMTVYHQLPLISLLINIVAIPVASAGVMLSAAVTLIDCVLPNAGQALSILPDALLSFLTRVASAGGEYPYLYLSAPAWPLGLGLLYLGCVYLASPYGFVRARPRRCAFLALPVLCIIPFLIARVPVSGMRATFLDVGQGDCAIVDTADGAYMIDCGDEDSFACDYLLSRGIRPKALILTHADSDHTGGAEAVILNACPDEILLPECWARMKDAEAFSATLALAQSRGVPVTYLRAGDILTLSDDVAAEVLWPSSGYIPGEDNDASLVLRFTYGESAILFTGDITRAVDGQISADCDLLKVSHHGSRYATSETLLARATPAVAVISVGVNTYGHPSPETLDRLTNANCAVYRTDLCGAVFAKMEKQGGIEITTMIPAEEVS